MTPDQHKEIAGQLVVATPSLGAILIWLGGIGIEKWAALAGLCFIVVQAFGYMWRLRRDMRHEAERVLRGMPPPEAGDQP